MRASRNRNPHPAASAPRARRRRIPKSGLMPASANAMQAHSEPRLPGHGAHAESSPDTLTGKPCEKSPVFKSPLLRKGFLGTHGARADDADATRCDGDPAAGTWCNLSCGPSRRPYATLRSRCGSVGKRPACGHMPAYQEKTTPHLLAWRRLGRPPYLLRAHAIQKLFAPCRKAPGETPPV